MACNPPPPKSIETIFGDAFTVLRNIKTGFMYLDKSVRRKIIAMIRRKLEYAGNVVLAQEETYKKFIEKNAE